MMISTLIPRMTFSKTRAALSRAWFHETKAIPIIPRALSLGHPEGAGPGSGGVIVGGCEFEASVWAVTMSCSPRKKLVKSSEISRQKFRKGSNSSPFMQRLTTGTRGLFFCARYGVLLTTVIDGFKHMRIQHW